MSFLAFDSPVMQTINRITDYVILNILWIVCSLPLFTAGAAMSAKYYVGMKMCRGHEPVVVRSFFYSFRSNLKQTVLPSVFLTAGAGLLILDWYFVIKNPSLAVYRITLAVVTVLFMMFSFCLFPIIARYKIKTSEAVKAALGMTGARFFRIFIAIALFILPFVIGIWYFKWAWLICLFSQTVMLYYNSRFFVKEFDRLEAKMFPEQEKGSEDGTEEE